MPQDDAARQVCSAAKDTVSPHAWRHKWRYHRYQQAQRQGLPQVDWGRYHLQVVCWSVLHANAALDQTLYCLGYTAMGAHAEASHGRCGRPVQILFVDHSDTVRARVAAGLFELIAEWNGFGRALYPAAAGVRAGAPPDLATTVALMAQAARLGIRAKLFAQHPEQFVYEDFDRHGTSP
jgi:hypothetical protein